MAMALGNPRTSATAAGLLQMRQQEEAEKFRRALLADDMQQKQAQLDMARRLQDAIGSLSGGGSCIPSGLLGPGAQKVRRIL